MKGEASPESISWLENLFEFNRDNGKIKQMRKDVETYEEAVRRQAALIEQARLKERAAREQEVRADTRSVHSALPWKTSGHTAVLPMPRTVPDISMHCRLRQ